MLKYFIICSFCNIAIAEITTEVVQYLNELPLDKLLRLKSSLQDFITTDYENMTTTTPSYLQSFGAEAMAIQGPPIKRTDYEEGIYKKGGYGKISNIFSMSVTTLAFLAFGGYLLCLIVQAVKSKQVTASYPGTQPTTFFVSAGIKKKPQPQFTSSYGRRKRDNRASRSFKQIDLPPEQMFTVFVQLCEGYAKWNERHGEMSGY